MRSAAFLLCSFGNILNIWEICSFLVSRYRNQKEKKYRRISHKKLNQNIRDVLMTKGQFFGFVTMLGDRHTNQERKRYR